MAEEAEADLTLCEYQDCEAVGWRVLCWGPRKTAPLRVACWQHEGETDLTKFRERVLLPEQENTQ